MNENNKTHVDIIKELDEPVYMDPLNKDGIGFVESFDFSTANIDQEHRVYAISKVASICYGNPKAAGSIKLYDRLYNESMGLPSSSFEFVPVLIRLSSDGNPNSVQELFKYAYRRHIRHHEDLAIVKYGYKIGEDYILTNLRALISDVGSDADKFYNTKQEEIDIIRDNFHVFNSKITMYTRTQLIRHRVSFQELSRRYISNKRAEFEFYLDPKIAESVDIDFDVYINLYNESISSGVKPEVARGLIPQCAYTTIWSAWTPRQFYNFLSLRLDPHAQEEIRNLASLMNKQVKTKKERFYK